MDTPKNGDVSMESGKLKIFWDPPGEWIPVEPETEYIKYQEPGTLKDEGRAKSQNREPRGGNTTKE